MTAPLTPLAVTALGLLVERPMHPYEMYQLLVAREEHRLVKVRPGSLYHTVDRLARDELVVAQGTERDGNRPERTTYALTRDGHAALTDRIREMLRRPVDEYPQFPVGVGEAHNLEVAEVCGLLTERIGHIEDELSEITTIIESATTRDVAEAYWVAADYLRTLLVAERDWLVRQIARLDTKDLPWPTPPRP